MIAGLSGSLLSHEVVTGVVPALDDRGALAERRLRAWHDALLAHVGPASGARIVFDRIAAPLAAALGFKITRLGGDGGQLLHAVLETAAGPAAAMVVTAWGREPGAAWRDGVRHGIGAGVRWCLCLTGPVVRVVDARRTYSRRFAEFDLGAAVHDRSAFAVFWGLLSAAAFPPRLEPVLDRAVGISERHRLEVRASLQVGVHDALTSLIRAFATAHGRRRSLPPSETLLDESLIVVYRVLFMLFAEARGLVPKWHPTYRGSYTIESLRTPVEVEARPKGLWASLQAIARLAHRGCNAGTLRVPPFNGRLFSPAHAPLAESAALDDGAVRQAVLALTSRRGRGGPQRIAYADLGVEQLGGVYERILDFGVSPAGSPGNLTLVRSGRRKSTGAFYTPRALTEFLVRRTLAPLVRGADPDRVLSLRVLDPAMGSGAFLVAACRYLAVEYEAALVRDGSIAATDLTEQDRAAFRRVVAQRCLFGVDVNPMAVQLGRLSLWLATLSADRPLTFLDHHLRAGNTLVGASLADIARPPLGSSRRPASPALPLFETNAADVAIGTTVGRRLSIADEPGDTIEQIRSKERAVASLQLDTAPLAKWKAAADLWCSNWFQPPGARPGRAAFGALLDGLLGRHDALPGHVAGPLIDGVRRAAAREGFFHWELEFPEVFHDPDGRPTASGGFDAVVGNPPWDVLRADGDDRNGGAQLVRFARSSGIYHHQGGGHVNLYQLFVERALALTRPDGRVGLVLPSGFASDHGCATLRRWLLDRSVVDTFVSIENRDGLFPIHRGLKFLLLGATRAGSAGMSGTSHLPCRFGVRQPSALDGLADAGSDASFVTIPRSLIERFTGDQLAVPELRTPADVSLVTRIAFSIPALGDPGGWHVAFGRELNATDDRRHFVDAPGGPQGRHYAVIEGKQLRPFAVDAAASRRFIRPDVARSLLDPERSFGRARLAYRDVASSSNRLTLVAAVVPARVVTTHTLFCLKDAVPDDEQHFLCAVFNSFVANYLVRLRVSTHVTVSIVERLPVPRPARDDPEFRVISALGLRLAAAPDDRVAFATLQAHVARLYRCTAGEFRHVLDTFPLVPQRERVMSEEIFVGFGGEAYKNERTSIESTR